jgi:hypothetical protein
MAGPVFADPPSELLDAARTICLALPETYEEPAWTGIRWCVRKRNFAHVFALDEADGPSTMVAFRSSPPELDVLLHAGHPFFPLGWGRNVIGLLLDDATDWDEVRELLTESYCVLAPKKLIALVDRPGG